MNAALIPPAATLRHSKASRLFPIHAVKQRLRQLRESTEHLPARRHPHGPAAPVRRSAWVHKARTTHREPPERAEHNRPHTLRRRARTDDASPLAVRGANAKGRSPPTPSRAWRAHGAPDEGRCRADPHCTRDGSCRHNGSNLSFRVTEQHLVSHGQRELPPGHPAPRGRPTQTEADLVLRDPEGRQDRHVRQGGRGPTAVGLSPDGGQPERGHVSRGPGLLGLGGPGEATTGSSGGGGSGSGGGRRRQQRQRQRHTLRPPRRPCHRVGRTPPAPTPPTGRASANTSRGETTAKVAVARTNSSSVPGIR